MSVTNKRIFFYGERHRIGERNFGSNNRSHNDNIMGIINIFYLFKT